MGLGAILSPECSVVSCPWVGRERGLWDPGHLCCLVLKAASSQPWTSTDRLTTLSTLVSPAPWNPSPAGSSLRSLDVTLPPSPRFHCEIKAPFPSPHPARLNATGSILETSQDDLRDLTGLGQYPREGRGVRGSLSPFFHNKSLWELNVPGLGPEANSALHFSADLSLGLNLKSVIAAPIERWEAVMPITVVLVSLPAIFFPLTSLGWFKLIPFLY